MPSLPLISVHRQAGQSARQARAASGGRPTNEDPAQPAAAVSRGPRPRQGKLQWDNGSASPPSLNSRDRARTQRQVRLAASCSRRTDENGGGSLAWVSVCLGFLCVVEEIGLQSELPHSPKLCKNLMKIFFLPHQSLFYACVLQWAAKPHYCSVTICSLLIYYFLLLLISCTETILVSAMTLHVPGVWYLHSFAVCLVIPKTTLGSEYPLHKCWCMGLKEKSSLVAK